MVHLDRGKAAIRLKILSAKWVSRFIEDSQICFGCPEDRIELTKRRNSGKRKGGDAGHDWNFH